MVENASEDKRSARSPSSAPLLTREQLLEVYAFLRGAGQVINNSSLYGPSHKITERSLRDSYGQLVKLLGMLSRVNLSVVNGELVVRG